MTTEDSETETSTQQELTQSDNDFDQHSEQAEYDAFNRKERLQQLEDGIFPHTNTILSAVFQEIKRESDMARKKSMKNKVHIFEVTLNLPTSINGIFQAGKLRSSKYRAKLTRFFRSRLPQYSGATVQKLVSACSKDSVAYLHADSTRFPVA